MKIAALVIGMVLVGTTAPTATAGPISKAIAMIAEKAAAAEAAKAAEAGAAAASREAMPNWKKTAKAVQQLHKLQPPLGSNADEDSDENVSDELIPRHGYTPASERE